MSTAPDTSPWYFRQRGQVFGMAYGAGFFLGYLLSGLLFADATPLYVRVGNALHAGPRAGLGLAVLIVLGGYALRLWGSSYLSRAVVWNEDVLAGPLRVSGPYRFTRNPLYLGNLIIALGVGATAPWLATVLVVAGNTILVMLLIRVEERRLRSSHGERYDAYARAVPQLFPTFVRHAPPGNDAGSLGQALRSEILTGGIVIAMLVGFVTANPNGVAFWAIFAAAIVLQSVANASRVKEGP